MKKVEVGRQELIYRHLARKSIRSLFDDEGFIEVETPCLLRANTPDPHIDPIWAHLGSRATSVYQLRTSPEIWLKHALARGMEKIYEMTRVFRDDPLSPVHHHEFTMLEWYRSGGRLADLINDCRAIFQQVRKSAIKAGLWAPKKEIVFVKHNLDFLFRELAGLDLRGILYGIARGHLGLLQEKLSINGEQLPINANFSDAFSHVMLKYIEPKLPRDQATIITQWPIQFAALAAVCQSDPCFCDRFEIYYGGLEIANAYQECVDESVIRQRFEIENKERAVLGKPTFPISEEFLLAIKNMPQSAGIALGLDRLLMAIAKKKQIKEIIFGANDHC